MDSVDIDSVSESIVSGTAEESAEIATVVAANILTPAAVTVSKAADPVNSTDQDTDADAINEYQILSTSSNTLSSTAVLVLPSSSKVPPAENSSQYITKARLSDLIRDMDPNLLIEDEVEDILMDITDEFVENVVNSACLLAKHRKSNKIEVKDIQLHLERNLNMWIPGFGTEEVKPYKRATVTDPHKQRLALIRKANKKI